MVKKFRVPKKKKKKGRGLVRKSLLEKKGFLSWILKEHLGKKNTKSIKAKTITGC